MAATGKTRITALLLWFVLCALIEARNPGLRFHISQHGINYAADVALKMVSSKIAGEKIPDQSGKSGRVHYDVTGMHVSHFTLPHSQVTLNEGQGLTWSTSGGSLGVHGDWKYKLHVLFVIQDHGSFDASVSDIDFSLHVTLGVDGNGRPTIRSTGCTCNIGHVSFNFNKGGLAGWFYNLFSKKIASSIRDNMHNELCNKARKVVDQDAEQSLAKLELKVPIGMYDIDYRLIAAPAFHSGFLESYHKGEAMVRGSTDEAPFPAPKMAAVPSKQRMVYVSITDYVMNTLGFDQQNSGYLKYRLTKRDLPKNNDFMLNATCHGFGTFCIGNFLQPYARRYPGSSMEIQMRSTERPTMYIEKGIIRGRFTGRMDYYANTSKKNIVLLFATNATADLEINAWMKDNLLYAKVTKFNAHAQVFNSHLGQIPDFAITDILQYVTSGFVTKQLNKLGAKGFMVPAIKKVHFVNTQTYMDEHTLTLGTDLQYRPAESLLYEGTQEKVHLDMWNHM